MDDPQRERLDRMVRPPVEKLRENFKARMQVAKHDMELEEPWSENGDVSESDADGDERDRYILPGEGYNLELLRDPKTLASPDQRFKFCSASVSKARNKIFFDLYKNTSRD